MAARRLDYPYNAPVSDFADVPGNNAFASAEGGWLASPLQRARLVMSEAEYKEAVTLEDEPEPARLLPPPWYANPVEHVPVAAPGWIDVGLSWIERRPIGAAATIFAVLLLLHLVLLNVAGVASGIFVGNDVFLLSGSNLIEIVLLAFTAYNIVLPTLFGRACVRACDELRPALAFDEQTFAQRRMGLQDAFSFSRLCFGLFWAVILTPVFGNLFRASVPGVEWGAALLSIWMYVRIALTFGLLGASITYVARLHHRFRAVTSELRVDLFDMAPLQPVARYARLVALFLIVLLALAGPVLAQPEAIYASAAVLTVGVVLTGIAVAGAMWGARRAIRTAKKTAQQELQAYSRELWRRAYANGRVAEAVAIPALGAMLTVRAEIARIGDWPGGWSVFARLGTLAALPILSWFGGQITAQLMQSLVP